jgi:hypothetical protein
MSDSLLAPCTEWAVPLAARPEDLSPFARASLQAHVAVCAACSAAQVAYRDMDARIHGLPAPQPLAGVPRSVLDQWAVEARRGGVRGRAGAMAQPGGKIRGIAGLLSEGRIRPMRKVPPALPEQQTPVRRVRAPSAWMTGAVTAVVVALFAILFVRVPHGPHGPQPAAGPQATATGVPTPAATPIPAADLRAAYLGTDGHLHLVTLDGTQDTTGPALTGTTDVSSTFLAWADASASPDGRYIAYISGSDPNQGSGVTIVDVISGATRTATVTCSDIFWSPDSTRLIADADGANDFGAISVVNAQTGAVMLVPGTYAGAPNPIGRALGWIDPTHVAVLKMSTVHDLDLASLDVASGKVRTIAPVSTPPDVFLAPDGQRALLAPNTWSTNASAVDMATGKVSELPQLGDVFAGKLVNVDNRDMFQGGNWATVMAWKPGMRTVALSLAAWGIGTEGTTGPAHQQAGIWLLDLDHDSAMQITTDTYPLAWLPDGHSLLMSSLPARTSVFGGRSVGPILSILSPVTASAHPVTLTRSMVAFFGLVRAA